MIEALFCRRIVGVGAQRLTDVVGAAPTEGEQRNMHLLNLDLTIPARRTLRSRNDLPMRWATLAALTVTVTVVVSACTAAGGAASRATGSATVATPARSSIAAASPSSASSGSSAPPAAPNSTAPARNSTTSTKRSSLPGGVAAPSTAPATSAAPVVARPAAVTSTPAWGSVDVNPGRPVTVTVAHGVITALTLTSSSGRVLNGKVSADRSRWTLSDKPGYGRTYTIAGSATGTDGKKVPIRGSFSTLTATSEVRTTISPGDGKTMGVATSVIVAFGVDPVDRAAVARAVSITTSPKVTGAWVWIQHDDGRWALDFRTQAYWPANTKVHVQAKMYGVKFADGAYGTSDVTSDFTIGRNQVVKADVNSHDLLVFRNGKQVASYPASFGKGDTPDKITRSGIHVVNDMFPTKLMSNPKYGYVNVLERWAVRMSDNGEFIHANPKTVGDQGNTNVSHGCVNLSLASAAAYYKSTLLGDPVEVTGTSIQLSPDDGDLFDWSYTWARWKNMSVSTS